MSSAAQSAQAAMSSRSQPKVRLLALDPSSEGAILPAVTRKTAFLRTFTPACADKADGIRYSERSALGASRLNRLHLALE